MWRAGAVAIVEGMAGPRRAFTVGRRGLLRGGAAVVGASMLPFTFTYRRTARAAGYGELVPDPDGILDLPPGFTYKILSRLHDPMSDGYRTPGLPDAMGTFAGPDGSIILMRNHELGVADVLHTPLHPEQAPPPEAFNPGVSGGVTRLVIDNETLEVKSSNLVLFGTMRNCAGGVSPWGWISCEESVDGLHGYAFLCDPMADRVQKPRKIAGYGRYRHEAACVDPRTYIAYLTEDRGDGCLYRFVPDDVSDPFKGKLQALRVIGTDAFDTSDMLAGQSRAVTWVDIDDPEPSDDSMRVKARAKGAAEFNRGEGIFFWQGAVYVCATSGGPAGAGQVFRLVETPEGSTLECLAASEDPSVLDHPDNIAVAPWGELFMAEDGDGDDYIRVLTPDGAVFDFARNAKGSGEFSGVCFSPDGRTLFVNLMWDHLTVAIRGPFPEFVPPPEETTGEATGGTDAPTTSVSAGTSAASTTSDGLWETGKPALMPETSGPKIDDNSGCGCAAREGGAAVDLALGVAAALALRENARSAGRDEDA